MEFHNVSIPCPPEDNQCTSCWPKESDARNLVGFRIVDMGERIDRELTLKEKEKVGMQINSIGCVLDMPDRAA